MTIKTTDKNGNIVYVDFDVKMWADLVSNGTNTIDEVPKDILDEVKKFLNL